YQGGGEEMALP
nr:Chain B, APC membrane recruitment protein 1 [Homo sapiens]